VATGKLPSSTILRLPGGPLQARPDLTLAEWALLCRVDGGRPVSALANRSGRGHHEAIGLAERLLAAGLLELAGGSDEAGKPQEEAAAGTELDHGRGGTAEVGASRQAGSVWAEVDGQPGSADQPGKPQEEGAARADMHDRLGADEPGKPQEVGTAGAGAEVRVGADGAEAEVRVGADEPGAAGVGSNDRVDSTAGALAVAELAGLSSADAPGEGDRPARTEAAAELGGLGSAGAPGEGDRPARTQAGAGDVAAGTAAQDLATGTAAGADLAAAAASGGQDGGAPPSGSPRGEAALPGPADGASDGGGPPGAGAEPAGLTGAGAPGGGGAAPGRDRIDPVSLLRELAAERPPAEGAPAGDGEDLTGLAARLAGGQAEGERSDQPAGGDRRPRDKPARPPGRGANQAEFLREFASLAMGGDPADDPDPGPQPDGEPADDERGRGRFGFRRGPRR
jgi:hypothetical protein